MALPPKLKTKKLPLMVDPTISSDTRGKIGGALLSSGAGKKFLPKPAVNTSALTAGLSGAAGGSSAAVEGMTDPTLKADKLKIKWDKISLDKVVPYMSNLVNAFRTPPSPTAPGLQSSVKLGRASLENARTDVKGQIRNANLAADQNLNANAAAAAKVGALGEGLRQLGAVNERETAMNLEQSNQETGMNAEIQGRNLAASNAFNDDVTNRKIAYSREQSENLANAADKFVMMKNEDANRKMDITKMGILGAAYNSDQVAARTMEILKKNYPDVYGQVKLAEGGPIGPGKLLPNPKGTPEERNLFAKEFAARNGHINAQETYVDPNAQFVGQDGQPFTAQPTGRTKAYNVPAGIGLADIKNAGSEYWYDDPHTGDPVYVDKSVLGLKRFKTNNATDASLARPALAKLSMGGSIRKAKLKPLY